MRKGHFLVRDVETGAQGVSYRARRPRFGPLPPPAGPGTLSSYFMRPLTCRTVTAHSNSFHPHYRQLNPPGPIQSPAHSNGSWTETLFSMTMSLWSSKDQEVPLNQCLRVLPHSWLLN